MRQNSFLFKISLTVFVPIPKFTLKSFCVTFGSFSDSSMRLISSYNVKSFLTLFGDGVPIAPNFLLLGVLFRSMFKIELSLNDIKMCSLYYMSIVKTTHICLIAEYLDIIRTLYIQ